MVGRKGCVSCEEFNEVFSSLKEQIIVCNKVVEPSAKIWSELHINVFSKSNPKAIYSSALRWFARNKEQDDSGSELENDNFLDISVKTNDTSASMNNTTMSPKSDRINFNIYLSSQVWKTISPVPKRYNRKMDRYHNRGTRTYFVLQPGVWTNVILEKMAEHRRNIVCNWTFDGCKVYVTGTFYVVVSASCKTCGSKLRGYVKDKPKNETDGVKFCFTITNFDEERHNNNDAKAIKNTGEKAKNVFQSSKSALALHQQMASENISMFGESKGRTFTMNAIRCGKYRVKKAKKLSNCPIKAIEYLQAMNVYANTIHLVGSNPLVVLYISPNQIRLYSAYKKHNSYIKISIDATGGLVILLESINGIKRPHILLFSMCISDGFQISISSLLTEKQDANFISYWLSEFLRLGRSIPNELVCDMSPALLSAGVQAFGLKSCMSDYLDSLFNILNGVNDVKPRCFIRIDIAHFIKDVAKCKALKNVRTKHRDFFIRSVALMIKMKSLKEARDHILAVMVVALSETEGFSTDTGDETVVERYKQLIIHKIKGINEMSEEHSIIVNLDEQKTAVSSEEEAIEISHHGEFMEYLDEVQSNFTNWIKEIEREARALVEEGDNGDRDNLMFSYHKHSTYLRGMRKQSHA